MKLMKKGDRCRIWHRQEDRSLDSLLNCLKAHDFGTEEVKLTVIVDGRRKDIGNYVSVLFPDYDRKDLLALHEYRGLWSKRMIVETNTLPDLPFIVAVIDEEGNSLVTFKLDVDGWTMLQFEARITQIHSLVQTLERLAPAGAAISVASMAA